MTTVAELEMPAERLALSGTFERAPTFEFQVAGMIGGSPPLVWTSGPDRPTVEAVLEDDPTVEVIASLASTDEERWLFRLEFDSRVKLFEQIVAENDGAILEASGREGAWSVKLLFHGRGVLSTAHERFGKYGFDVTVRRVSEMTDVTGGGTPLTETQYETIAKAHELGYFDVPRQVTLQELAAELDVSHQALSERLRRSHAALVSAELTNRMTPAGLDP